MTDEIKDTKYKTIFNRGNITNFIDAVDALNSTGYVYINIEGDYTVYPEMQISTTLINGASVCYQDDFSDYKVSICQKCRDLMKLMICNDPSSTRIIHESFPGDGTVGPYFLQRRYIREYLKGNKIKIGDQYEDITYSFDEKDENHAYVNSEYGYILTSRPVKPNELISVQMSYTGYYAMLEVVEQSK